VGAVGADIALALTVGSFLGLTGIGLWRSMRLVSRRNRLLRFRVNEPLDIVLSTTRIEEFSEPIRHTRALTSIGHLEGVTGFSEAVGAIKRRGHIRVHVSRHVDRPLDHELVLIGGPVTNEISRLFLDSLNRAYPELRLEFGFSQDGVRVALGGFACAGEQQAGDELFTDWGLIVGWINPFAPRRRRAFLCAGITPHGTAAAAAYLLGPLTEGRSAGLRRRLWPRRIERLRELGRWPAFALVTRIVVGANGGFTAVEERIFVPLDVPRAAALPLVRPVGPSVPPARGETAPVRSTSDTP
jgi:hypothetical protein